MSTATEITEYRVGRNFIRQGDRIKVRKGWNGTKNGFESRVLRILANPDGTPSGIEVKWPWNGSIRTIRPEFIERKRQTKNGQAL